MADWLIQERGRVRSITDERLRRKIRRGRLTGEERIKPEGELGRDWQTVSSLPVFQEEAGPSDPATLRRRALQRSLAELGGWTFISFAGFWWAREWAFAIFGLGVLVEGIRYASALAGLPRAPLATGGAPPAVQANKEPADPFLAELKTAIDELQKAASAAGKADGLDLPAVRKAAEALHRRRLDLLPLCDPTKRAQLDQEQDQVIGEADQASDPRLREVLRQQAFALEARLKAMGEASAAAARLQARERTLLHQVENLRLSHLSAHAARLDDGDQGGGPSLAEEARRIQAELSSEAEVEETAARARLATQPRRTL